MNSLRCDHLPEILLLGLFPFPIGTAGSNVMLCLGKALRASGFSVGFVTEEDGRPEDKRPDGSHIFQGFPYYPLGKRPFSTLDAHTARKSLFLEWLRQVLPGRVKCVLTYSCTSAFLLRLRRLCKEKNVQLVGIVAEFYDWRHFPARLGALLAILDSEANRRIANRLIGKTVCLSRYLDDYYQRRGGESLLLPPFIDLEDSRWGDLVVRPDPTAEHPLRLIFSGTSIRDRQDIILKGLSVLRDRGRPVVLEYSGTTREQLSLLPGVGGPLVESLKCALVFHGKLEIEQYYALLHRVDFGILMRDDARWSRACFPSKVPEFLAAGVPMLCNLTSDLADYLADGDNSIIVSKVSVASFVGSVERALKLERHHRNQMRRRARETAGRFHAPRYARVLTEFLGRIGVAVCAA